MIEKLRKDACLMADDWKPLRVFGKGTLKRLIGIRLSCGAV